MPIRPLKDRRVVVTGVGVVSPLGNTAKDTWEAAVAGRSGVSAITRFDPSDLPVRIGGEVKGFDPAQWIDKKEINPSRAMQDRLHGSVDRGGIVQVESNHLTPLASRKVRNTGLQLLFLGAAPEIDLMTRLQKSFGDCPPDPAIGTGDQSGKEGGKRIVLVTHLYSLETLGSVVTQVSFSGRPIWRSTRFPSPVSTEPEPTSTNRVTPEAITVSIDFVHSTGDSS